MRFPWSKAHKAEVEQLREAIRVRDRVREQWPDVREGAQKMRRHKQRNHFGPNLELIYASRRKP